jgi:Reverse transcriptase (RNA-dependent DNA polymerase)
MGVEQWKKFLEAATLELTARPQSWLVVTDLSQYFETIRFRFLRRQLEEMLGDKLTPDLQACIDALMSCLSAWSPYEGYGLPQNMEASSFLGNVLLDRCDKLMERDGFPTIRYMDDIRIVVPSEADARNALIRLVCCLRDVGLGLNPAKTEVLRPDSEEMRRHQLVEDPEVTEIERAIATKDRSRVLSVVAPGLVKRCFLIAIQGLNRSERNAAYERFAHNDIQTGILASHLQGLHEPIYVDNPPGVSIEDLPDCMPSIYA